MPNEYVHFVDAKMPSPTFDMIIDTCENISGRWTAKIFTYYWIETTRHLNGSRNYENVQFKNSAELMKWLFDNGFNRKSCLVGTSIKDNKYSQLHLELRFSDRIALMTFASFDVIKGVKSNE